MQELSDVRARLSEPVQSLPPLQTASPHLLISLLLDGAMRNLQASRAELQHGEERSLAKAGAIVRGLQNSLDLAHGGYLAANLADLYDYMLRRLEDAARDRSEAAVREVETLLATISEAWDAIASEVASGP